MNDKTITTSKHYIKYIRIVDNTGYENYLEQGHIYGVLEHMTGDIACYYKLDVESPYKEGCWISAGRCSDVEWVIELPTDVIPPIPKQKKSLEDAYDEPVPAFNSERLKETLERWAVPNWQGGYIPHTLTKHPIVQQLVKHERIICIPDENGHIVDLQRVQYISPVDKGSYKVTLVSGWEMPLTDKLYSREKLIGLWRSLQNK